MSENPVLAFMQNDQFLTSMKNWYTTNTATSERSFQYALIRSLEEKLSNIKIYIEPRCIREDNLSGKTASPLTILEENPEHGNCVYVPDLLISANNKIIASIELKFLPCCGLVELKDKVIHDLNKLRHFNSNSFTHFTFDSYGAKKAQRPDENFKRKTWDGKKWAYLNRVFGIAG